MVFVSSDQPIMRAEWADAVFGAGWLKGQETL
jgi:hypothetical protein